MGHGVKKMRSAMVAAGLRKPKFDSDLFFTAIFYRSPEFSLKQPTQIGLVDGLGKTDVQIISLINANNNITKREMAEKIQISSTAIDKHIAKLKEKGILQRIGSDRYGYWNLLNK